MDKLSTVDVEAIQTRGVILMNDLMKDRNFHYILAAAACVLVLYYIMSPLQQCFRDPKVQEKYVDGYCYRISSW